MQSVMMVLSLVLAALVAADAPLWTLFATKLTIGIANTVNAPAFSASIPLLVDRLTGGTDGVLLIAVPPTVGEVRVRSEGVTFYRRDE